MSVKGRQGATVGLAAFQSHLYQVTSGTDVSSSKVCVRRCSSGAGMLPLLAIHVSYLVIRAARILCRLLSDSSIHSDHNQHIIIWLILISLLSGNESYYIGTNFRLAVCLNES